MSEAATASKDWLAAHPAMDLPDGSPPLLRLLASSADVREMLSAVAACAPDRLLDELQSSTPASGSSALHIAAWRDLPAVLDAIVCSARAAEVDKPRRDGMTPFMVACSRNGVDAARALLRHGADPARSTAHGSTSLHIASFFGHQAAVRLLLGHPRTDLLAKDQKGTDALICAAGNGHAEIVQMILAHERADVNARKHDGATPLFVACHRGSEDCARLLLSRGADVALCTTGGWSPMHAACLGGHTRVASLLLHSSPGLIDSALPDGTTPLYIACSKSFPETAEYLLRCGANMNTARADGRTPLLAAIKPSPSSIELVRLLKQHGFSNLGAVDAKGFDAMRLAEATNRPEIASFVRQWIEEMEPQPPAQPPAQPEWYEMFRRACADESEQAHCEHMVRSFPERANSALPDGKTLLSMVCSLPLVRDGQPQMNKHAVVAMLLRHGASAGAACPDGWTPLHFAAAENDVATCGLLMDHDADPEAPTSSGATPLYVASSFGCIHALHFLIGKGCDVDARQMDGSTPLFIAAQSGHIGVMRVLIAHGADTSAMLSDGRSVLSIACRQGHIAAVRLLLRVMRRRSRQLGPLPWSTAHRLVGRTAGIAAAAPPAWCKHLSPQDMAAQGYLFDEDEAPYPDESDEQAWKRRESRREAGLAIVRDASYDFSTDDAEVDTVWAQEYDDDGVTRTSGDGEEDAPPAQSTPLDDAVSSAGDACAEMLHRALVDAVACGEWRAFEDRDEDMDRSQCFDPPRFDNMAAYGDCIRLRSTDSSGASPIFTACLNGHTHIALLLMKHGALEIASDAKGRNILWAACFRNHQDTALAILDHAGDAVQHLVSQPDQKGVSPLFLACENGLELALSSMISKHSRNLNSIVNTMTHSGHTPLFAAAYSGSDLAVRLLTACGASVRQEGPGRQSCLHIACERGHLRAARSLLKHPHPVSTIEGALAIARRRGHADIASFLSSLNTKQR
jgi:ankyrin repeat protein